MSPREHLSYSSKVKDELLNMKIKNKCCRRSFADAAALDEKNGDVSAIISGAKMICGECANHFAAGTFVKFGNVTDPEKSYHLEFSFKYRESRDAFLSILSQIGYPAGTTERKGRFIAYYKSADMIVDLLATMGANNAAFEYINSRIVKGIRNDTNRQVNFDSANILKSLNASKKHVDVINSIVAAGYINELSAELRETAVLRTEYPEASLVELGLKFSEPISKSGVKHRLDKIMEFARDKKLI